MKEESNNKFFKGFGYAFSGIRDTYKTEPNFRFHFFAMILVILLGLLLSISGVEWLWVFLAIALVMAMELINTALEALADSTSAKYNPLIKKAKDAAAAAVLVVSIFALLIGICIFVPKILILFRLN
jgi:diacylglycerol kinase